MPVLYELWDLQSKNRMYASYSYDNVALYLDAIGHEHLDTLAICVEDDDGKTTILAEDAKILDLVPHIGI